MHAKTQTNPKGYAVEPFLAMDKKPETHSVAEEFYRRAELDAPSPELIEAIRDENPFLSEEEILSVAGTMIEHRGLLGATRGGLHLNGLSAALDGIKNLHERVFFKIRRMSKCEWANPDHVWRSAMLLLGYTAEAGATNVNELVKVCGGDPSQKKEYRALKSKVNKCLKSFQNSIPELPPIAGQRSFESRQKMAHKQFDIWHKKLNSTKN